MTIKELFDKAAEGTLTLEQFEALTKEAGAKFVDLSEGGYVSKRKYEDEISAKDTEITTLNSTIESRDVDLGDLRKKLEEAGTDADKLASLTGEFDTLKGRYESDVKAYKEQLKKQAYEFAVKEFAASKKFTSNAAKRDFIQSMIAKELKMDKDIILGAEDFVTAYSKDNEDAFFTEAPKEDEPSNDLKPTFVNPTPGGNLSPVDTNAFSDAFHFIGVRPHEN